MAGRNLSADEAEQQLIHDRSVIDHLIGTFHASGAGEKAEPTPSVTVYEQIRREWPESLTLGARII